MFSHCGIVTLWGPDAWTIIDHCFRLWLEPFLYQAITWVRADHLSNPPRPIMKLYHRSLDQESHRAATTRVRRKIWLYLDDNKQKTTKQDKHPKHSCTDVSSGGVFPAKMIRTRLWCWPDSVIINYYTSTSTYRHEWSDNCQLFYSVVALYPVTRIYDFVFLIIYYSALFCNLRLHHFPWQAILAWWCIYFQKHNTQTVGVAISCDTPDIIRILYMHFFYSGGQIKNI